MTTEKKKQAIRDPIHEWIPVSKNEMNLIDHPLVQRLRHTCQLSGADLIFPGAVHNRFSHSLGVMHVAGEFARVLYPENPHKVQVARIAGLLHDIGHGPFSHAYDSTVYSQIYGVDHHGHDLHRNRMIKDPYLADQVQRCGVDPEEILDVWSGKDRVLHAITQGPVGADRLDFLMRDSYYSGTGQLGNVLPNRLMDGIRIVNDPQDGLPAIAFLEKVMDDVTSTILSRFHMYKAVYHNKGSTAVMLLVEKMLKHAAGPLRLAERTHDLSEFVWLNDATLIGEIMNFRGRTEDERMAKMYCEHFLGRRLPKLHYESIVRSSELKAKLEALELMRSSLEITNPGIRAEIKISSKLSPMDKEGFTKDKVHVLVSASSLRADRETKVMSFEEYLRSTNCLFGLTVGEDAYLIARIYLM